MANQKRKRILEILRRGPVVASQLQGTLGIDRDEAVRRLRALVDEGAVDVQTVEGLRTYQLTRPWRERLR